MRERPHDEQRHQILEHAAAPRHERGRSRRGRERAPEPEPVLDRHIVLGDRHVARQTRFRCEQIVIRVVQRGRIDAVADGEKLAPGVVEKREVHLHRVPVRRERDGLEPLDPLAHGRVAHSQLAWGLERSSPQPRPVGDMARGERSRPPQPLPRAGRLGWGEPTRGERGVGLRKRARHATDRRLVSRIRQVGPCALEQGSNLRHRLPPCRVPNSPGARRVRECLVRDRQCRRQRANNDGVVPRGVDDLETRLLQRDEVPREVAAVDRGDVRGLQHV